MSTGAEKQPNCGCGKVPCCCADGTDSEPFLPEDTPDRSEAYARALTLLERCASPDGFLAAPTETANYRRVWSRDGVIIGLAALMSRDTHLIDTFRRTLLTLANHQGPQGEIPSNVDAVNGRVSYGGTTGRVDASLWFIIGCGEYWRTTGDGVFLESVTAPLRRATFLLRAWEFNNRGLLFVPPAGDWADEYVQSGYVLYDQLLYLQAQRTTAAIYRHIDDAEAELIEQRCTRLEELIRANYWFQGVKRPPPGVYHDKLYQRGFESDHCRCHHWVPFFSPHGYGYRFDAFANVLASLLHVADDEQRDRVDGFVSRITSGAPKLLPAFHPVIAPIDDDWEDLQMTFSYTFRNHPYEYHNGGLWPMVTGFYAADLAQRGLREEAAAFLDGINWAGSLAADGEPWSFPEFIHGRDVTPGGTQHQAWSAAAAVMGRRALDGEQVLRVT